MLQLWASQFQVYRTPFQVKTNCSLHSTTKGRMQYLLWHTAWLPWIPVHSEVPACSVRQHSAVMWFQTLHKGIHLLWQWDTAIAGDSCVVHSRALWAFWPPGIVKIQPGATQILAHNHSKLPIKTKHCILSDLTPSNLQAERLEK